MSLSHEGSKCSKQALTDSQTTLSCPFSSFNHQPDKVPSFQMTDRTQGPLCIDSAHLGPFNISRPFTSGSPNPLASLRTTFAPHHAVRPPRTACAVGRWSRAAKVPGAPAVRCGEGGVGMRRGDQEKRGPKKTQSKDESRMES